MSKKILSSIIMGSFILCSSCGTNEPEVEHQDIMIGPPTDDQNIVIKSPADEYQDIKSNSPTR